MRSLSRTWPPITDRYARMRKRAATVPNAEQLRAEFEQAWAEVVSAGPQTHRLIVLPTGSMRRPTRADRRCKRMRAQLGRTRSAAERRMHRLIVRSWMNRGAYSAAEVRSGFGLPAADQFIDACLPVDRTTFPGGETTSERMGRLLRWAGFDKPIEPYDLSAPADILVELPEPLTGPLDAVEHIISGSPLYERHRGAQANDGPTEPFPPIETDSDLRPYDLSDLTPEKIPGATPSRFTFTDQHYNPRLIVPERVGGGVHVVPPVLGLFAAMDRRRRRRRIALEVGAWIAVLGCVALIVLTLTRNHL